MAEQTLETAAAPTRAVNGTVPATLNGHRPASTADLVRLATDQVSQLVRDEVALAKLEMSAKAKKVGLGAGLFGGAGLFAAYGLAALLAGAALAIALVLPAWAAALIIGGGLFLLAGLLALVGRSSITRAGAPMPNQTIDSVKTDVHTLSQAVKDGRQS
jgi:Putative Actinobacterial Holin-X, holin superfamily III